VASNVQLSLENGTHIAIRFGFDPHTLGIVRNLPARRYVEQGGRRWLVPVEYCDKVFEVFPHAWVDKSLSPFRAKRQELETAAKLPDAPHPSDMACALFPYQRADIAFLRKLDSCLNHGEPGIGKTRSAIGWSMSRLDADRGVQHLHGCLVVCPSSTKYFYRDEILRCMPSATVAVVEGRKGEFPPLGADYVVLNWNLLHHRKEQILAHGFACVVFSEAHAAKGGGSTLRGQAAIDIGAAIGRRHCETGSPVRNRPRELAPLLQILGKLHKNEVFRWLLRFCNGHQQTIFIKGKPKKIWDFSGASHQDELAAILRQFSIGRRKKDVFGEIPPITYSFPLVDLANRAEYDRALNEMFALKDRMAKEKDEDEARRLGGEILGFRVRLHQLGALGKVDSTIEQVQQSLGENLKTLVFCDYLEPLYRVQAAFGDAAVLIEGALSPEEKYEAANSFQSEPAKRLCLCSPAGYYGVTLTAASTVIFMSVPYVPEDWKQARDRAAIRADNLNRSNIHCMTLLARKSMDIAQASLMYEKSSVIEPLVWHDREDREMIARFADMVEVLAGRPPRRSNENIRT
jgi:SWI/SNF-related matrix-associated actin-dependent regulator 1 of chromatin subfamily A